MIEIIPAIDIIDGKCVRLTQGDYSTRKIYNEDPLEVAKEMESHGVKRLHVVDLDGAKAGHIINYKSLERLAAKTDLIIDFGGGLKHDKDLDIAFDCGAQMVTGGSVAVKNHDVFIRWIERFGSEKIILGADAIKGKIAIEGWEKETALDIIPFISDFSKEGVKKVICTDISRDGMLEGPAVGLYCKIMNAVTDINLIASGGVSSIDDIEKLDEVGVSGVIFGKAIYEGRISMKDLEKLILRG